MRSWYAWPWLDPVPCGQSVVTARRSNLFGYAGYGYCASHSRWYWGATLMLIATPDGTVTGFGLANPKLAGERDEARQMLTAKPATSSGWNTAAGACPQACGHGSSSDCWR